MDKQDFIYSAAAKQAHYSPNDAVKEHLKKLDLIAVVGPTGAGKNSIINHSGIPYVLSDMTRAPRKHETDGVDANFRIDYDGLLRDIQNGLYVQYFLNRNGEFYGTKNTSYPAEGYCAMPIYADALPVFKSLPFRKVIQVYIVPPSYEALIERANAHHDKDLPSRLAEARRSLEAALSTPDYHFLLNEDIDQATATFKVFVATQGMDEQAEKQARETALQLLTHFDMKN